MIAFFTGHWEILIVLVVALLLFGHRIPGLARSLGSGIVEFKKGLKGDSDKKESGEQVQLPPPSAGVSARVSEADPAESRQSGSATPGSGS